MATKNNGATWFDAEAALIDADLTALINPGFFTRMSEPLMQKSLTNPSVRALLLITTFHFLLNKFPPNCTSIHSAFYDNIFLKLRHNEAWKK